MACLSSEQQTSFEGLVSASTQKFTPSEATETAQAEFEAIHQRTGETLVELHSDIKRLADRAFPGLDLKAREIFENKQFLAALADR